jgi:hypothetical protein
MTAQYTITPQLLIKPYGNQLIYIIHIAVRLKVKLEYAIKHEWSILLPSGSYLACEFLVHHTLVFVLHILRDFLHAHSNNCQPRCRALHIT